METLQKELAQLTPEQVKELLGASGHANLLANNNRASQDEAERKKEKGNAFFRQQKFDQALEMYSICIELDANNAVYLSNRAAVYLKLNKFQEAIEDCTRAIALTASIKPLMRRATAYVAVDQFDKAVKDLKAALQFEPQNKECYSTLKHISEKAAKPTSIEAALIVSVYKKGWKTVPVKGNPAPPGLNGHALFQGPPELGEKIYLFGGRSVREQKAEIYVLNDLDSSWDVVLTSGTPPSTRAWHTVSPIDDTLSSMCVYGGVSSHGEDTRIYLLVATEDESAAVHGFRWVHPASTVGQIPLARSAHASVSVFSSDGRSTIYMFGGRTKNGVTAQLFMLRFKQNESSSNTMALWDEVPITGAWPSARDGHSMCLVQQTMGSTSSPCLVVFGGNGQQSEEKMNDTWIFDLENTEWTQIECTGDVPSPRSYHTAHALGQYMLVIGGRTDETEDSTVYLLDIDERRWFTVPIPEDYKLSPRAWHASVLTKSNEVYLLGGGTFHGPLRDAAVLDLSYFGSYIQRNMVDTNYTIR